MKTAISWVLRLALAGVFLYAGSLKALSPVRFATDISNYHLLPWPVSVAFAFYLPWLEIACGLALLLPRLYRGSLANLTGLVLVFIIASVGAKARGLDVTCGCFGHVSKDWSFSQHLLVDFAIFAALLLCCFRFSPLRRN